MLKVEKVEDEKVETILLLKDLRKALTRKELDDFVNKFLDEQFAEIEKKYKYEDFYLKVFDDSMIEYLFEYSEPVKNKDNAFTCYHDRVVWKEFLARESFYPSFLPYDDETEKIVLKTQNGINAFRLFNSLIDDLGVEIERGYYTVLSYLKSNQDYTDFMSYLMDFKFFNNQLNLMVNNIFRFAQYDYIEEDDFIKLMKHIEDIRYRIKDRLQELETEKENLEVLRNVFEN